MGERGYRSGCITASVTPSQVSQGPASPGASPGLPCGTGVAGPVNAMTTHCAISLAGSGMNLQAKVPMIEDKLLPVLVQEYYLQAGPGMHRKKARAGKGPPWPADSDFSGMVLGVGSESSQKMRLSPLPQKTLAGPPALPTPQMPLSASRVCCQTWTPALHWPWILQCTSGLHTMAAWVGFRRPCRPAL